MTPSLDPTRPFGLLLFGNNLSGLLQSLLTAQELQTPAIAVPVDWLEVGHVDEVVSFYGDGSTPKALIADSALGWSYVEEANAEQTDAPLVHQAPELLEFVNQWNQMTPAQRQAWAAAKFALDVGLYVVPDSGNPNNIRIRSLGETVAINGLGTFNTGTVADRLREVQNAVEQIVGVGAVNWKRTPVVFRPGLSGKTVAMTPNLVNWVVSGSNMLPPAPFFSNTQKSGDLDYLFWAFAWGDPEKGIPRLPDGTVVEMNDWWWYHVAGGESHCATNARRAIPAPWWSRMP